MHLMYDCSAPSNSEKEKSNLLKNPTITSITVMSMTMKLGPLWPNQHFFSCPS